jgi:hypothetical protein
MATLLGILLMKKEEKRQIGYFQQETDSGS